MQCRNPGCRHRRRYGAPAEFRDPIAACPHCGEPPGAGPPVVTGEVEFVPLLTVATFREACAAHLARGRLEAEGILARVLDEHLAGLHSFFGEAAGGVHLKVLPEHAQRARDILTSDHSEGLPEAGSEEEARVGQPCPVCGLAAAEGQEGAACRACDGAS